MTFQKITIGLWKDRLTKFSATAMASQDREALLCFSKVDKMYYYMDLLICLGSFLELIFTPQTWKPVCFRSDSF